MIKIKHLAQKYIFRLWSMYDWFLLLVVIWTSLGWIESKNFSFKIDNGVAIVGLFIWLAKKLTQLHIHFRFLSILRTQPSNRRKLMLHPLRFRAYMIRDIKINSRACMIGLVKIAYSALWAIPCLFILLACVITGTLHTLWWLVTILGLIPLFKYYYSYGLAQYIYHDGNQAGQMVTVLNAPKLSKMLFREHIITYMRLQLEVTIPVVLCSLAVSVMMYMSCSSSYLALPYAELTMMGTFIILMLAIAPYLKLIELQYYQDLINQRAQEGSHLYKAIKNRAK